MTKHNKAFAVHLSQPASLDQLSDLTMYLYQAIELLYEAVCDHVEAEGDDPDLSSLRLVPHIGTTSGILTYVLSMETR